MPKPVGNLLLALVVCGGTGVSGAGAQEAGRCAPADRFLTQELNMATRIDLDTLDDWRTRTRVPACRITSAGARASTIATAARIFYERVRAAGWTRTPDPRDAPNESSLRFRLEETDCLFNVYQGPLLGTESEIEVTDAVEVGRGDALYHVLVLCMPAMEAAPRATMPRGGVRRSPERVGKTNVLDERLIR